MPDPNPAEEFSNTIDAALDEMASGGIARTTDASARPSSSGAATPDDPFGDMDQEPEREAAPDSSSEGVVNRALAVSPRINAESGEEGADTLMFADHVYQGISMQPVTPEQAAALLREVQPEEVEIRPDGAVYLSHAKYRERLNEAFRPGGWGMRQLTPYRYSGDGSVLYADFALYAEGRYLGLAKGEQRVDDRSGMTYGDLCEGVKSNALMRCCKDLGMALQCWNRSWTDRVRAETCVKVYVRGKNKPLWRRLTDPYLPQEERITDDSPNRDHYVPPVRTLPSARREPSRQESARSAPEGRSAPTPGTVRTITESQARRLYAITMECGVEPRTVSAHLRTAYGVSSSHDIPAQHYDAIVAWVREQARN
jgi:hypothetical protein